MSATTACRSGNVASIVASATGTDFARSGLAGFRAVLAEGPWTVSIAWKTTPRGEFFRLRPTMMAFDPVEVLVPAPPAEPLLGHLQPEWFAP